MNTVCWIFSLILLINVCNTVICQIIFGYSEDSQSVSKCGDSSLVSTLSPLIVNGIESKIGNFPWYAGLYYREVTDGQESWDQKCGGSLITDQFVLTAAHCVYNTNKSDIRVALGKINRTWDHYEYSQQKRNVLNIVYPYEFKPGEYVFDIALLLLDEKIKLGKLVMPVCVGFLGGSKDILEKKLYIAGWGQTKYVKIGSSSETLLYTDVKYLPTDRCLRFVPAGFVMFERFCTIKNNNTEVSSTQKGDSGGGLTVVQDGKHYIYGIVSTKIARFLGSEVGLFTNLTWPTHISWLEREVGKYDSGFRWSANTKTVTRGCKLPNASPNRRFCSMAEDCDEVCSFNNEGCLVTPGSSVESVKVVCAPGYSIQSSSTDFAFCLRNRWYPRMPECHAISCDTSETIVTGKGRACKGAVIFEDQFKTPLASNDKWKHVVMIPDKTEIELAVFNSDPKNSFTSTKGLVIKPTKLNDSFVLKGTMFLEGCTGEVSQCSRQSSSYDLLHPVQSARLTTRESFSFRYGIVEIRAKLPLGDWLVPELWLEPLTQSYGRDYASGRIRVAMNRGNIDFKCNSEDLGANIVESGVMLGNSRWVIPVNVRNKTVKTNMTAYSDFHNYTLIWTPEKISFKVDDQEPRDLFPPSQRLCEIVGFNYNECLTWTGGSTIAPFDQDFYISLGVAVGSARDFPKGCSNRGISYSWRNTPDSSAVTNFWLDRVSWTKTWTDEDSALYIEHIRVTAL